MSGTSMTKCDGCGKTVANPYAEPGWIQIHASNDSTRSACVTRSWGAYDDRIHCYKTDFLENVSDFCGIDCLVRALDVKRKPPPEPCKTCGRI